MNKHRTFRPPNRFGWWLTLRLDDDHRQAHFERYLLPAAAVVPWHPSVLATIPGVQESFSCALRLYFWVWRASIVIGRTLPARPIKS